MRLRKTLLVVVLLAMVGGLLATTGIAFGGSERSEFAVVAVIQPEHDVLTERGWTFQDALETVHGDPIDGWDGGRCTNLDADDEATDKYMCELVFDLPRGTITAEGPFDINEWIGGESIFAVTGGTGAYRHIRGEVSVQPEPNLTYSLVVFRVTGAGGGL